MFRRPVSTVLALGFVALLSVMAISIAIPGNCAAADQPIFVQGTIYDSAGNKIPDIPVTINMKDGATIVTTKTATSDANGEYGRLFLSAEWEIGYTVQVIATGPAGQAVNSTAAPDLAQVTVDVHFNYEIPEFGFDAGVLVAGIGVGLVAVGILVWRRK